MSIENAIKYFGLNNLTIESELRRLQASLHFDIGKKGETEGQIEKIYYPQFPEALRLEAAQMSEHYQVLYSLENSIRDMIIGRLSEQYKVNWWVERVPEAVKETAAKNREREAQQGITPRSERDIDYINFGELGEIIKKNWDIFSDTFKNRNAVERILSSLNMLRGPIAHCSILAEDEVDRLQLALKDWFRQMS